MTHDTTTPQSRRALLAGALGGLAAAFATALGRPGAASAAAGSTMIIGSEINNAGSANTQLLTNSNVVAFKLLQNGPGTALMGYVTPATGATRGVYGRTDSPNGYGVQGRSAGAAGTGAAMQAIGLNNVGLEASSENAEMYAVLAHHNDLNGTAIRGISVAATGVHGSSTSGVGVLGSSTGSHGVYGTSTTGAAGYFAGNVEIAGGFLQIEELDITVATPAAHQARIFTRDNGASLTQLVVTFPNGQTVVLAAESV